MTTWSVDTKRSTESRKNICRYQPTSRNFFVQLNDGIRPEVSMSRSSMYSAPRERMPAAPSASRLPTTMMGADVWSRSEPMHWWAGTTWFRETVIT